MSKFQDPKKAPAERPGKRVLSPKERRQVYLLVINSILLLFLYFGSMSLKVTVIPAGVLTDYPILLGQVVFVAYWAAFAIFLIAYIAYNRAFTRRNVTSDMLPPDWSPRQKADFIEDGRRRLERSRWMLSVIIPLLVTVAADALYLFTWPIIQNLFSL